jgi:NADH:ubiquinone oxidoreductase subunit 6 (subunit J)
MTISRTLKPFLAVAVVWPLLYFVAFMFMIASGAFANPAVLPIVFIVHAATAVVVLGTLTVSIIHAVQSNTLTNEWRIVWSVLLLFGAIITVPIYFFMHIWPNSPHDQ